MKAGIAKKSTGIVIPGENHDHERKSSNNYSMPSALGLLISSQHIGVLQTAMFISFPSPWLFQINVLDDFGPPIHGLRLQTLCRFLGVCIAHLCAAWPRLKAHPFLHQLCGNWVAVHSSWGTINLWTKFPIQPLPRRDLRSLPLWQQMLCTWELGKKGARMGIANCSRF